jgi:hypothetical protein
VRLHRPVVFGGYAFRCAGEGLLAVAFLQQGFVRFEGPGAQPRAHAVVADERALVRPGNVELARGEDRGPLALRHHADEIPDANRPRTRDVTNRGLVDLLHLCPHAGGPQHAPVQHGVDLEIVHEHVTAGDLAGNVRSLERLADNGVRVGVLERRLGIDREAEPLRAGQVADGVAGSS